MDIVITGSIAYDYIMFFPGDFTEHILPENLDKLTLSFHVHDMSRHWGGTGANIAYTLALLGERPKLVATAGKDFEEYQHRLDAVGVDTSTVREFDDVFTASFYATVDQANRQLGFFYGGAMDRAPEVTLKDTVKGQADLVTISPTHRGAMIGYGEECRELGIAYLFDPGQQIIWLSEEALRESVLGAAYLAVNAYEYELLLNKTGLTNDDLMSNVETIIITEGKDGTRILHGGQTFRIPVAPPVEVVDPTGAGDAFRGGFLKGLAQGWPLELTGRVGALAATYTIEGKGPQSHSFTPQEFVERFREAFPDFDDAGALDSMLAIENTASHQE
jgi:adenosine kinase